MIFISHRGNLNGPSDLENHPDQIEKCVRQNLECEIDLWSVDGEFYLGHDRPQYKVVFEWLVSLEKKLWVHCKNPESLQSLSLSNNHSLNYFWHQSDNYTITSKKNIWVFPGQDLIPGSIAVLPEIWKLGKSTSQINIAFGICTDYVKTFMDQYS